jgi:hypothetical protein
MEFCTELDHKHTYKFYMKHCLYVTICERDIM